VIALPDPMHCMGPIFFCPACRQDVELEDAILKPRYQVDPAEKYIE
jgi:hypothetical protein